jgi:hypothetical protein
MPRIPWWVILAVLLFAAGAYADHRWWPRIEQVQVAKEITKLVPVPGPTVVKTVVKTVPVEVSRPGPERIVTVTHEVQVPVEVVREKWPQTITVHVGSVQIDANAWVTPKNPDLLIGQVTPGVYAVPAQPGWAITSVTTSTQVPTVRPGWQFELHPLAGALWLGGQVAAGLGAEVRVKQDPWIVSVALGTSTSGAWGYVLAAYSF